MRKLLFLFAFLVLAFLSCEKEVIDYMQQYYTESMGLQSVTIDSIRSFSKKVNNYVLEYPEGKEHPLYPKIQQNIKVATLHITLEADSSWNGTIDISFNF